MIEAPDDVFLIPTRCLDAEVDRSIDGLADVRVCLTNLQAGLAVLSRRVDRVEARVERRLELVDLPH